MAANKNSGFKNCFFGNAQRRLDDKGRFHIPDIFKKVMQKRNSGELSFVFLEQDKVGETPSLSIFDAYYLLRHQKDYGALEKAVLYTGDRILIPKKMADYAQLNGSVNVRASEDGSYFYLYNQKR